jgi:preprotein translocase subunit SecD
MRRFVKLRLLFLLSLMVLAGLTVAPSVARIAKVEVPSWLSQTFTRQFKLGLDLQGGLHLEYSVAVDDAIRNNLDRIAAELEGAFKEKKELEVKVEREGIDTLLIRFPKPEDIELATPDVMAVASDVLERMPDEPGQEEANTGIIRMKMPQSNIAETRSAILNQAKETVNRRVDAMGVAEPSIYTKSQQIVVELPGASDSKTEINAAADSVGSRILDLLREGGIANAQRSVVEGKVGAVKIRAPGEPVKSAFEKAIGQTVEIGKAFESDKIGMELQIESEDAGENSFVVRLSDAAQEKVVTESSDFRRLLRVIERSAVLEMHLIDDEAISAPGKAFDGKPYIKALYEAGKITKGMGITVSRESDYGAAEKGGVTIKSPYVLYAKDRQTLENFFANLSPEWQLPNTHKMGYEIRPLELRRGQEPIQVCNTHVLRSRSDITGDRIVSASVNPDPQTGLPQVAVKFDRLGAQMFDKMSGDNVGRKMAIILDDLVASDPVFNERIPTGNVVINMGSGDGKSVREKANDLTKILKSGSLPARLNKESETRMGAELGQDSVVSGFWAFVTGLCSVVAFMAVYYRRSGVISVIALVMNMMLILAAMALFQATLTLPGIAGIVLTIGMAVDANVLIFERMRECLRDGYTPRAAIEAGYDKALSSILDSQLTTAIAAIVLMQYGSGPIRGFAVTLLIGIGTSIFTAVYCTRAFFDLQANRSGFDRLSI